MKEKENKNPVPEPKKKRLGDYTAQELNALPVEERQRLFTEAILGNLTRNLSES